MKLNNSFLSSYNKLNKNQKKAVDTIEGPVMLIAGPGTGKTQTLTLRIANILLKSQINPENILVLTFTENAAYEMKNRLGNLIGSDAYKVHIHTFHGFCNELIQKHYDVFRHLASYEAITEVEEIEIIRRLIDSDNVKKLRPSGDPDYYIYSIRSAISSLKKEGIHPNDFERAVLKWENEFLSQTDHIHAKGRYKGKMKGYAIEQLKYIEKSKEFGEVYKQYEIQLNQMKLYDFNDMIIEVSKVLQSENEFLQQMQETYHYILIDEHQDTNNAQNRIIELLCNYDDYPNLFVVGDEKQSIFRFQGASLENFLYFQRLFPQAVMIELQDNYRSSQTILDGAYSLIMHSSKHIISSASLTARSKEKNELIILTSYGSNSQELFDVVRLVKQVISKNKDHHGIAVLFRKNIDAIEFAEVLKKEGIQYTLSAEETIFVDIYVQKIKQLLLAVCNIGVDEYLGRILFMNIFNNDPYEIFNAVRTADKMKISLWDYAQKKKSTHLYKTVLKLKKWKEDSEKNSLEVFFIKLLHESGIIKSVLREESCLEILQKIELLFENIKRLLRRKHSLTLREYINYLSTLEKYSLASNKIAKRQTENSVYVSTVHKAKGLEFDYVFIPRVVDSIWGKGKGGHQSVLKVPWRYFSKVKFQEDEEESTIIDEERRLFYVALTRARKQLFLSYSLYSSEAEDQLPSRFIHEINPDLIYRVNKIEETTQTKERILATLSPLKRSKTYKKAEMRDYFYTLFVKNGVSVTALNNFIDCPWKYIFRNLIRLPDTRNIHLLLGSAVHDAIREYIVRLKKRIPFSEEKIIDHYKQYVDRMTIGKKEMDMLISKGVLILQNYYQKQMTSWDTQRESEIVIPNIYLEKDIFINGKIDMMEYISQKKVRVFDFKTGSPKSRNAILGRTKNNNLDYHRQLVFYKLLLSVFKNGRYVMEEGVIEFVESAQSGDVKKECFIISPKDVAELKNRICNMKNSIMQLDFWEKTCGKNDCIYCLLRSHFYRPLV